MSLINEALKRAEEQKQNSGSVESDLPAGVCGTSAAAEWSPQSQHSATADPSEMVVTTVATWTSATIVAAASASRRAHRRALLSLSGTLAVLLIGMVALWSRTHTEGSPARATANPVATPVAAAAAAAPGAAKGSQAELDPGVLRSDAELAASSIRDQLGRAAGCPRADSDIRAPVVSQGAAPPASIGGAVALPAAQANVPVDFRVGSLTAGATSQPESRSVAQPPKTEASRFTLGGIIRFNGESMATINGKLLRAGEMIDGGKIVRIESQSVDMESNGERFTLRM